MGAHYYHFLALDIFHIGFIILISRVQTHRYQEEVEISAIIGFHDVSEASYYWDLHIVPELKTVIEWVGN